MDDKSISESSLTNFNFSAKIKDFFELSVDDELIRDFECYLLKNFLLKGTLFVLQFHLCFHASLNRSEKISYQGWMHKKSRRTKTFKQHYFILRNNELAWFDSPTNFYFPINSVLLNEVNQITTSKSKPKVFHIGTCTRNYTFHCNTKESMMEWMQVIQRATFTNIHDGDDIKIVIPYSNITQLQHTSTNENMPECLICQVEDEECEKDDYYFCNFYDYTALRNVVDSALSNYKTPANSKSPLKDNLPPNLEITTNSLRQLHLSHSQTIARPKVKHRKSLSAAESPSINNHFFKLKWFKNERNDLKIFPIPESETTLVKAISYYLNWMPIRGTVYMTNKYLCFRSMIGFNIKACIPIRDIFSIDKQTHKYALHNGLNITTVDGHEFVFEFYDTEKRNKISEHIIGTLNYLVKTRSAGDLNSALQDVLLDIHTNDSHFKISRNTSFKAINDMDVMPIVPMKIVFLTIGSRGDVQPFISLAIRFQKDGHTCTIATHSEYKEWIISHGIDFKEVKGDPAQIMKLCINHSIFSIQFIREVFGTFREWLDDLLLSSYQACIGCDCIIESGGSLAGIHISELLQVPYFRGFMMPWTRNTLYPHPFAVPTFKMGGRYNYSTYVLFDQMLWQIGYYVFDNFRTNVLGLKSKTYTNLNAPFLYGFSPVVVPSAPEWQDVAYVCGYWFLDSIIDYECPVDLLKFFDTKTPVLYIGFGSIIVDDPAELTNILFEAVKQANCRAVVCKGWSGRDNETVAKEELDYSSHLYIVDSIPHDWLFERVSAVVHHGGSGTTAAGLRSGKPTIIKPFFGDQFFWAQRVVDLGVGLAIRKLTVERLSEAIVEATTSEVMMKKAAMLGQQIKQENGVETALKVFYSRMGQAKQFVLNLKN
eukprot:NODE_651_length_5520_cov_0.396975.p1 type:complete len:880 gc:universal NODE_651_length_5520_cov_0.396975:4567-1928(-)